MPPVRPGWPRDDGRDAQRRVARAAGVNLQTLRYYERRGLIRDRLRAVSEAGCDDLLDCVDLPCCSIPFEPLAEPQKVPT